MNGDETWGLVGDYVRMEVARWEFFSVADLWRMEIQHRRMAVRGYAMAWYEHLLQCLFFSEKKTL